jgi:putative membrane protein
MRILRLLLLLFMIVLGSALALQNADPVPFDYYFDNQKVPLALLLVGALLLGALLGWLSALPWVIRLKAQLGSLKRRQKLERRELDNLRSLPLKD